MADPVAAVLAAARSWRAEINADTMGQWADQADFDLVHAVDALDASSHQPAGSLHVHAEYSAHRCTACGYVGTTGDHHRCGAELVPVRVLIVAADHG